MSCNRRPFANLLIFACFLLFQLEPLLKLAKGPTLYTIATLTRRVRLFFHNLLQLPCKKVQTWL